MKITRCVSNGIKYWRVHFLSPAGGDYGRRFFRVKADAVVFTEELQRQKDELGGLWLNASAEERLEMFAALRRARAGGYRLGEALDFFEQRQASQPKVGITVAEVARRYMAEARTLNWRARSVRAFESNLTRLLAAYGNVRADRVTDADI